VQELNEVVHGAHKTIQRLIGEDIRVTTTLARDAGAIYIEPHHAVQIVMNLAVNARDAMPQAAD
jgi:hypothetical protein